MDRSKKNVDGFCHLQSLVKGVVTIVLKTAAVNGQWLNVESKGQGNRLFFQKKSRESIGFYEKVKENLCFLGKSQGNFVKSPYKAWTI